MKQVVADNAATMKVLPRTVFVLVLQPQKLWTTCSQRPAVRGSKAASRVSLRFGIAAVAGVKMKDREASPRMRDSGSSVGKEALCAAATEGISSK